MENKKAPIQYTYAVINIGTERKAAYKAFVPAINSVIFGATLEELERGIRESIILEAKHRKAKKMPMPKPERISEKSGKLVLRLRPELHDRLSMEALAYGKSLNAYITEKVAR